MTGKLPKIQEPQPPPSVRVKVLWFELNGTGIPGIAALIVILIIMLLAAYAMRGELTALLHAPGELLSRVARSRLWV